MSARSLTFPAVVLLALAMGVGSGAPRAADKGVIPPAAATAPLPDVNWTRKNEYIVKRTKLRTSRSDAYALRDSDPDRYVVETIRYCEALQQLITAYADLPADFLDWSAVVAEYALLGTHFRYVRHDPRRAIELYRRAAAIAPPRPPEGFGLGALVATALAADTVQFDLRSASEAASAYRDAAQRIRAAKATFPGDAAPLFEWFDAWFRQEGRYLAGGKRFGGRIAHDSVFAVELMSLFAVHASPPLQGGEMSSAAQLRAPAANAQDPAYVGALLREMPPSRTSLAAAIHYLPLLQDAEAILAFLARNDPSGYWTATIFAAQDAGASPAMRRAAELLRAQPGR